MKVIPHTIKAGERWDSIAYRYYGDALDIARLTNANPQLALCEVLPIGAVLLVPVITHKRTNQNDLPPWLRNQE